MYSCIEYVSISVLHLLENDIRLNTSFSLDRFKIDVDFLFERTGTIEKGFYGSNTSNV